MRRAIQGDQFAGLPGYGDHVTSSHVMAVSGQTGELVPLYCTSHGKALLSDYEAQDLVGLFGPRGR